MFDNCPAGCTQDVSEEGKRGLEETAPIASAKGGLGSESEFGSSISKMTSASFPQKTYLLSRFWLQPCLDAPGAAEHPGDKLESSLGSQRRLRAARTMRPAGRHPPAPRLHLLLSSPSVGSALGDLLLLFNRSVLGRSSLGADLPGAAAGGQVSSPLGLFASGSSGNRLLRSEAGKKKKKKKKSNSS